MKNLIFIIFLLTIITSVLGILQLRDSSGFGRRRTCRKLSLPNGRVRNKPRIFAQFTCNSGYLLMGERYMKCTDGRWDGRLPICVKPSCKIPQRPEFGNFFQSYSGAVLTFFCNPYYVLHGTNFTYCDGNTWNNHLPSCIHEDSNASVSCDFERQDLCGWSHSLNHDFRWERLNLRTPSGHVNTGPKHDHTKGDGESGYYMYIESSYRNENDTATLISPVHQKQLGSKTCLEFYYHMYGSGIGQLKLFVKFVNRAWSSFDWNLVYAISGNQGDKWHRGFVDLGDLNGDFQVIFQGIRGISYVSDIAIDDVKLIEDCKIEELTTITTEFIDTSTIAFESCENRCFKSNETITLSSSITSCDCDENCQDRSSCCPDFSVYCILEYTTDATEDTTVVDETTLPSTMVSPSTIFRPKTNKIPIFETTTSGTQTSKSISTTKTTTTTPKPIITTKRTTTTSKMTSTTTSTTILKPKIILPTTKTSTLKSTTASPTSSSSSLPTSGKTRRYIDDVATFPTTKMISTGFENEPEMIDEKTKPSTQPNNSLTVKVVIVCTAVVFVVLILVFVSRKISIVRCLKMKKMRNSNGDSQSDVRFLTSDEVLDFTLATPSTRS